MLTHVYIDRCFLFKYIYLRYSRHKSQRPSLDMSLFYNDELYFDEDSSDQHIKESREYCRAERKWRDSDDRLTDRVWELENRLVKLEEQYLQERIAKQALEQELNQYLAEQTLQHEEDCHCKCAFTLGDVGQRDQHRR